MRSAFRSVPSAVAVVMAGALAACSSDATSTDPSPSPGPALAVATTGNGAPSGEHYNLNIIAVSHPKSGDLTGGGNVIFVNLGTKTTAVTTKIMLDQSAVAGVFAVVDKDGTDGEARFLAPGARPATPWARALGKPYGEGTLTTCATDVTGVPAIRAGDICLSLSEVFVRGTGKSSFRNVTSNLTTISLDPVLDAAAVDACGGTTVNLFDGCLEGYFWKYDNNGLKLLQLRFYPGGVLVRASGRPAPADLSAAARSQRSSVILSRPASSSRAEARDLAGRARTPGLGSASLGMTNRCDGRPQCVVASPDFGTGRSSRSWKSKLKSTAGEAGTIRTRSIDAVRRSARR